MSAASDRRRLIVNADDLGLSPGVNRGILMAHKQGIVTSASMMVRTPAALEAANLARHTASLDVGLHVDVGEWRFIDGDWRPVYERVPPGDIDALRKEVEDQVAHFQNLVGHVPTHLDSHQHAHLREPLRGIMIAQARSLGVPLRHLSPGIRYLGDFYGQDDKGVAVPGRLQAGHLATLISRLPAGLTELCCHPAAWIDFEAGYANERVDELKALCSEAVALAVEAGHIQLVGFGEVARGATVP